MTIFEALEECGMRWPRTGTLECPAHPDENPSLKLYSDHYYCFSCQRTGDAYGLVALIQGRDVRDVLKQYGPNTSPLMRASKETLAEIGPTALGKRFARRWTVTHGAVFARLHDVYGDEDTEVLVEEILRMGEMFDELRDELDELPMFQAEKRLREFEKEQMNWLRTEEVRLLGAGLRYAHNPTRHDGRL